MEKKTNRNFWIVFGIILVVAAISTVGNLMDYRRMDRLENQGTRILAPVDSVSPKGSKNEIFVTFRVDGNEFRTTKKVKTKVVVGDSVPVYFLPDEPSTNGIALE